MKKIKIWILLLVLFLPVFQKTMAEAASSSHTGDNNGWNGKIYRTEEGGEEAFLGIQRVGNTADYVLKIADQNVSASFWISKPQITDNSFSGMVVRYTKGWTIYQNCEGTVNLKKVSKNEIDATLLVKSVITCDSVRFALYLDANRSYNVEDCSVTAVGTRYYTGQEIKPQPKVSCDGEVLVRDRDYTLSYENNRYTGTAVIIIRGAGRYTGTKKITFKIAEKPKLIMSKTKLVLNKGEKYTLTVIKRNLSGKVKWSSSNKKIAAVSQKGKVTGKASGTVRITASLKGKKAICTVKIKPKRKASKIELSPYLQGIGDSTEQDLRLLAQRIGKMTVKKNNKYPDLYCSGNKMVIGFNSNAQCDTPRDIYLNVSNSGNKAVTYHGIKIGDGKSSVLKKLRKLRYVSYDGGKSYSNANAFAFYPTFKNGKLSAYKYICAPTG